MGDVWLVVGTGVAYTVVADVGYEVGTVVGFVTTLTTLVGTVPEVGDVVPWLVVGVVFLLFDGDSFLLDGKVVGAFVGSSSFFPNTLLKSVSFFVSSGAVFSSVICCGDFGSDCFAID